MAKPIPPRSFYRLTAGQQETEAVRQMNAHYEAAEQWKKLAQQARRKHIPDPEIDRPDVLAMKDA